VTLATTRVSEVALRAWAGDDLAELDGLYTKARVLERGRESWSERTMTDEEREAEDYQARRDRAAQAGECRPRHDHPRLLRRPTRAACVEAIRQSEALIFTLAARLRAHLDLGPFIDARHNGDAGHTRAARATRTRRAGALQRRARWLARSGLKRPTGTCFALPGATSAERATCWRASRTGRRRPWPTQ
jgi:hypothetical protein